MNCEFCNKECKNKNSLAQHGIRCKMNPDRIVPPKLWEARIGKSSWNVGSADGYEKEKENWKKRLSKTIKEKVDNGSYIPIKWSDSFREKQSLKMSTDNPGGRCKWYLYEKENGEKFNLQGTWELRFAKILDNMDPEWIKPGIGNRNHSFKEKMSKVLSQNIIDLEIIEKSDRIL